MHFKCGKTEEEKRNIEAARYVYAKSLFDKWQPKFAWLPKTIRPGKCVWLETYYRLADSVWDGGGWPLSPTKFAELYSSDRINIKNISWKFKEKES